MAIFIVPGGTGGGGTPGGSDTQVQFNDAGVFGGDSGLVFNKTTNKLTTAGDIELNDGGSFVTTIQTVTPTANRTLSFPDATGTLALVGGSSTQVIYNNGGALAGISTLTFDGTTLTTAGRMVNSYTSIASTPAKAFTGTWFTGGTATTTKPHFLIEPAGTTSTAWSTSGTALGVNGASGFAGNLLDLQVAGVSAAKVNASGFITAGTTSTPNGAKGLFLPNTYSSTVGIGTAHPGNFPALWTDNLFYLTGGIAFNSSTTAVARLQTDSDNLFTVSQRNGTNAQTFRVYNTYTSGTSYELGKLEWASNVFRIGTEKGSGGGTARPVEIHTDSISRLACDTTGSVRIVTGLTVATLPGTPAVGMVARVTDASAPAVGSTVAGGGAAAALVWWNGAAWSVIGV